MIAEHSLVHRLQSEAIDGSNDVSKLLRTAKAVAKKLDLDDALEWINRELDGYMDLPSESLPSYRQLIGELQGYNPYHGWQPVHFENAEQQRAVSQAPIGISIGTLEEDLKAGRNNEFGFSLSPETKTTLMNALDYPADVRLKVSYGSLYSILDAVRNMILNWSLELESAGVVDENFSFSEEDKKTASQVTQHIFAENVSFFGNVSDHASINAQQTSNNKFDIEINVVRDSISEVRENFSSLPDEIQDKLDPILKDIEEELEREDPQGSRLRDLLSSAKAMCEGAGGNLIAQGIAGLFRSIVG